MFKNEIEVDEDDIENIYNEILSREGSITNEISFSHAVKKHSKFKIFEVKKKKNEKELKISDEFAKGFVKALGGALLCVIPHPITWGIGAGLVVDGIKDMIEHAGDSLSEESTENKLKKIAPPSRFSN